MMTSDTRDGAPEMVAHKVADLLPQLTRVVAAEVRGAPDTAGLRRPHLRLLRALARRPMGRTDLARDLDVSRGRLAALLDDLARRGLVEASGAAYRAHRAASSRLSPGGRIVLVHADPPAENDDALVRLTPAGAALQRAIQDRAVAAIRALLDDASGSEQAALAHGLGALERGVPHAPACR
ncbi:MAG TPA: MarR family transcriptional regulator [Chloroflexota bacterium]|nr:MarR family transcriptional regulator [Chloroflexota bacterium]